METKRISWTQRDCNYKMNTTLQKVFNANKFVELKSGNKNADIIIPCSYDRIDEEIKGINPSPKQKIYFISNADHLAAKDYLWENLVTKLGWERASRIMPKTYIRRNESAMEQFKNDYKKNKLYILKKNIQRQEGLLISDSLEEILEAESSYVIVQELLQDPYVINVSRDENVDNRKINMRFYILITCDEGMTNAYVFNNGFMYYTAEKYIKNTKNHKNNITTGYIDRWIYEKNPLTHDDFKIYLDKHEMGKFSQQPSLVVFDKIYELLRTVTQQFSDIVGKDPKLINNLTFQLFGADIALNEKLEPMLMEINKGASIEAFDKRDGEIKYKCTEDIFKIIGAIPNTFDNGYIQLF
jgi:hypothetical protein